MENLESFGRYHLLVLLVFGLQILSHGMNLLIMPFSHKEVPHRCFTENDRIKGIEEDSIVPLNDFLDIFSKPKENMMVAVIPDGNATIESGKYQKEYWRKLLGKDYSGCEKLNQKLSVSCDTYVFTSSEHLRAGQNSIVRDFKLFCGNESHWSGKITMIGAFIGSIIGCPLSDQVGRKTVIFGTLVLKSVMILIAAVSNTFWLYAVCFSIALAASMAQYLVIKVYITEVFPTKTRGSIMALITTMFPVGYACVSLVAWLLPDWRHMYFALVAINFSPVFGYFLFYESPRWLQSKGRKSEAEMSMNKISQFSGIDSDEIKLDDDEDRQQNEPWFKVFKNALENTTFLKNLALLIIVWTNCTFTFFAISYTVGDQKGNMYR